ncbi:MAG: hypothetical protein ACFFD2_19275 [Promethearchaeota archaeon]
MSDFVQSFIAQSTTVGAHFIKDKLITPETLQDFAIHICHECRTPKFGRTCDKELSGIIHINALTASLMTENEKKSMILF